MEFTIKKCSKRNSVRPGCSMVQKCRAPTLRGGSGKSVLKPAPVLQVLHRGESKLVSKCAPVLQTLHTEATKTDFKACSNAPDCSNPKQKKCFEDKNDRGEAGRSKKTVFYTHCFNCSNAPYLYNNKKNNNKRGIGGYIYSPKGGLYARARVGATGAGRDRR